MQGLQNPLSGLGGGCAKESVVRSHLLFIWVRTFPSAISLLGRGRVLSVLMHIACLLGFFLRLAFCSWSAFPASLIARIGVRLEVVYPLAGSVGVGRFSISIKMIDAR